MNLQSNTHTSVGSSSPLESRQSFAPSQDERDNAPQTPDLEALLQVPDLDAEMLSDLEEQDFPIPTVEEMLNDTQWLDAPLHNYHTYQAVEALQVHDSWTKYRIYYDAHAKSISCGVFSSFQLHNSTGMILGDVCSMPQYPTPSMWSLFKEYVEEFDRNGVLEIVFKNNEIGSAYSRLSIHNRFLNLRYNVHEENYTDPFWLGLRILSLNWRKEEQENMVNTYHVNLLRDAYLNLNRETKLMFASIFYETKVMEYLTPRNNKPAKRSLCGYGLESVLHTTLSNRFGRRLFEVSFYLIPILLACSWFALLSPTPCSMLLLAYWILLPFFVFRKVTRKRTVLRPPTLFGFGDGPTPPTGGKPPVPPKVPGGSKKPPRKPKIHVPLAYDKYSDGESKAMKESRLKKLLVARTSGSTISPTYPLSMSMRDPVFEFFDKESKRPVRPPVAYTIRDSAGVRMVEKGNMSCLYDCMFAIYLGCGHPVTNSDEFEDRLTTFNTALHDSTHELLASGNDAYQAYLRGETAIPEDVCFGVCNRLSMRIMCLCNSIEDGREIPSLHIYGLECFVRNKHMPAGYSGLIVHTADGCGHFTLVNSLQAKFDADTNQKFGWSVHRIKDLLASFKPFDSPYPISCRAFSMIEVDDAIPGTGPVPNPLAMAGLTLSAAAPDIRTLTRDFCVDADLKKKSEVPHKVIVTYDIPSGDVRSIELKFEGVPTLPILKRRCSSFMDVSGYVWPVYDGSEAYQPILSIKCHIVVIDETGKHNVFKFDKKPSLDELWNSIELRLEICRVGYVYNNYIKEGIFLLKKEKEDSSDDDSSSSSSSDEESSPKCSFVIVDDDDIEVELYTIDRLCSVKEAREIIDARFPDLDILYWTPAKITLTKIKTDSKSSGTGPAPPDSSPSTEAPKSRSWDDLSGTFFWGLTYIKPGLSLKDESSSVGFTLFTRIFRGATAAAIWESSIARAFCAAKPKSFIVDKLFPKLDLLQAAYSASDNFNLFLHILQLNKSLQGDVYLASHDRFFGRKMGDSNVRRTLSNRFSYKYLKTVEVDDVYDYARPVNQIHNVLKLFIGRKTEYLPYDLTDQEKILELLSLLNDIVVIFPTIKKKTLTKPRDVVIPIPLHTPAGSVSVGFEVPRAKKVIQEFVSTREVRFCDLKDWEKILFLCCYSSGYKLLRSDFIFDMDMVSQLTSMNVLSGCKDYESASQRIDTKCSSVFSKYRIDKFALAYGVDICMNSAMAAKCIAYSRVEMMTSKQSICGVDSETSQLLDVPGKTKTSGKTVRLFGFGTAKVHHQAYDVYGYRTDEVKDMAKPGKVVKNFRIGARREIEKNRRRCGVTNYNVRGNLAPIADTNYGPNIEEGLIKRIGAAVPEPQADFKFCFPWYVKHCIDFYDLKGSVLELLVGEVEEMLDWEKYRLTLRYSPARQRQLDEIRKEVSQLETFDFSDNAEGKFQRYLWTKVEAHVKWESYHNEKKYVRMIFARVDYFKVFYGPYSKLVQKVMYRKLPCYVTNIPVRDLPAYLYRKLQCYDLIYTTDFSMFESHNYPWMYYNCHVQIYLAVFNCETNVDLIEGVLALINTNVIENNFISCLIDGKMMSGETSTTIGNTNTNFILISYIVESEGLVYGTGFFFIHDKLFFFAFKGRVEPSRWFEFTFFVAGDDGLFGLTIIEGVDYSKYEDGDYLSVYGVKLKISVKPSISGSGFLSKVYSEHDLKNLCDPLKQLSKGILPPKYCDARIGVKKSLARARAMSLLYEFGSCPIVAEYAKCILRCTRNVQIKRALVLMQNDDPFKFEAVAEAVAWYEQESKSKGHDVNIEISMEARFVVEENFDIPICTQLYMEEYFRSVDTTAYPVEFEVPCLDLVTSDANREFYEQYTVPLGEYKTVDPGYVPERKLFSCEFVDSDWYDSIVACTVHSVAVAA